MDDFSLPTPVAQHPGQAGLWDHAANYAQDQGAYVEPGFSEPSPFGAPIKRAGPPLDPEPVRTTIAVPPEPPKARPARKTKGKAVAPEPIPMVSKPKGRFSMPTFDMRMPKVGWPDPVRAIATPIAFGSSFWLLVAHLAGENTQGVIALAIMSALPLVLLWFLMDLVPKGLRAKIGAFGMVLLPVTLLFATLTTIAPYAVLSAISYWLCFPSTRGWLRRSLTWFAAVAIAWSITIFI